MANSLFRIKKIDSILSQGGDDHHGKEGLKRVLNVRDLTFFGIFCFSHRPDTRPHWSLGLKIPSKVHEAA